LKLAADQQSGRCFVLPWFRTARDKEEPQLASKWISLTCTLVFCSQTYGPFCRTDHEWFAKQAWLRESGPAAQTEGSGRPDQLARRTHIGRPGGTLSPDTPPPAK